MIRIASAQLWVRDQDEALDFWTRKVGMEVTSDVTVPEMGNFRWLAVSPPGQPDIAIVLMAIPGAPVMDSGTADDVRSLMSRGFAGTVFLTTEDCRALVRGAAGRVASSSPRSRRIGRTGSTPGSATRPGTPSG